ncbi:MAG: CHAT domain-containing protein [Cyanobacteriota bacterium]|nr:CHAT domain-containing protein [Cyanobacteriota bacterium]
MKRLFNPKYKSRQRRTGYRALLFVLSFVLCWSVGFADRAPGQTNETQTPDVELLLRAGNLDGAIASIEEGWKQDYESFFQQDFTTPELSADEIAQTLGELYRQTDNKPAVIWLVPRPQELVLVLIVPDRPPITRAIEDANRDRLREEIATLQRAVTRPGRRTAYLAPAQQLYNWLVAPVESVLEAENIETLLLCTGEGLRSFPFAALHDGKQFIVEKYSVALIPAFKLITTTYEDVRDARVLAMGASQFPELSALPAVPVELNLITPTLWQGEAFLERDFTVENLEAQRQRYPFEIVHLATHAEFNSGSPTNSFIQFADSQLDLLEMSQLSWRDPPVELLVLSACETALGDRNAELGFAGLALQSGVESVLASLWYVSDTGTLALMSEFYQQLKNAPTKIEALERAQIALIRGNVRVEEGKLNYSGGSIPLPEAIALERPPDLSHPFFWAAFTLIGSPW